MFNEITSYLKGLGNKEIAEHSKRFFKSGPGEYAEGDKCLGIRAPVLRKTVKKFNLASLTDAENLLKSSWHEIRLFALFLMVDLFKKADDMGKKDIYESYISHTKYINNWDLVDSSAHYIMGIFLADKDKSQLYDFAVSDSLWERRIAMMATFTFIKNNEYTDTLKIAKLLLNDKEDLIHKVVGWMLREIGNRDRDVEETFLTQHYKTMPRTMLRYAIEKFDQPRRQAYLKSHI